MGVTFFIFLFFLWMLVLHAFVPPAAHCITNTTIAMCVMFIWMGACFWSAAPLLGWGSYTGECNRCEARVQHSSTCAVQMIAKGPPAVDTQLALCSSTLWRSTAVLPISLCSFFFFFVKCALRSGMPVVTVRHQQIRFSLGWFHNSLRPQESEMNWRDNFGKSSSGSNSVFQTQKNRLFEPVLFRILLIWRTSPHFPPFFTEGADRR